MIDQRLGCYQIVDKLGEGGMGVVYRARDTKLRRDVAIKLLPDSVFRDPDLIARFEQEARLLASLSHPNVATLYGLEEADGVSYLVMELVPGETLAALIARAPLSVEQSLEIFQQIADGLEAAHEKGIVHRDLKPANVIIAPDGRPKVLDFGLAKSVTTEEVPPSELSSSPTIARDSTEQGIIVGTAAYMSPEQARGKTLDRRSDIFAFGSLFFEALTGKQAFPGDTASDKLAAILAKEPDWNALAPTTPLKIRDLLRRCLQKERRRRLQHIGDARIEIEEAQLEPAASPPRARPASSLPLAAVAFLIFAGVGIWALMRPTVVSTREVARLSLDVPREQAIALWTEATVAISPDGRRIVYIGGSGSGRRLYVRRLDEREAHAIPGTEGATSAFFSPDGEWVGFQGSGKLKKVWLQAGSPITLCDAPDPYGGTWGPGDVIVQSNGSFGLSQVDASGSSCVELSTMDEDEHEVSHLWPEILPDGSDVLFSILTSDGSQRVGVLSLETGERRVLVDDGFFGRYLSTGHLIFAKEEGLMAVPLDLESLQLTGPPLPLLENVRNNPSRLAAQFALSADGTLVYVPQAREGRSLVWVDRNGVSRRITDTRGAYEDPRLSPDGSRLAVAVRDEGMHVLVYDLARDAFMQVTFGSQDAQAPVWTPDGQRVTFRAGAASDIFWVAADGSGSVERIAASGYLQRPESFSTDGGVLVYSEMRPTTNFDIWVLTLDGERKSRPFLQTQFAERTGILSPDGRYLAYLSRETGTWEVYVQPFPGPGAKVKISSEGGRQPVWARSGSELFYRNGDKMMAVSIEMETTFHAERPTELFEGHFADPAFPGPQYDVAPDGEEFLMIQEEPATRIHVVLNWFETLKPLEN